MAVADPRSFLKNFRKPFDIGCAPHNPVQKHVIHPSLRSRLYGGEHRILQSAGVLLPCTQQHRTCLGLEEKPVPLHEFLQDPHRHPDIGGCGHTWLASELDVVWILVVSDVEGVLFSGNKALAACEPLNYVFLQPKTNSWQKTSGLARKETQISKCFSNEATTINPVEPLLRRLPRHAHNHSCCASAGHSVPISNTFKPRLEPKAKQREAPVLDKVFGLRSCRLLEGRKKIVWKHLETALLWSKQLGITEELK